MEHISRPVLSAKSENALKTTDFLEIQECIDAYVQKNERSGDTLDISGINHIVDVVKRQMQHSSRNYLSRDLRIEFDRLEDLDKKACIERFLQKFQERHYEYRFSYDEGIFLEFHTDNLFNAAFYQLAQMLMLPGRQVKLCPICRKFFVPEHGNQKYCKTPREKNGYTCYPEKMYKRKNYISKMRTSE